MTHLILIPTYKPDHSLFKLIDEYLINNKTEVLVINNGNNQEYDNLFDQISKKDIKEWADEESTIDKYKERYKRSWKSELKKSVARMLDEI